MVTFKDFLAARPATDDPEGDFAADALVDVTFPDAIRWSDVEAYLRSMRACSEAIFAARQVWRNYASQGQTS